ncbi:MAG TPA: PAS domain S-box protein [Anaerolineae bacterium]|nr:PAS domain S-box protein [Anaerolineae bacterium]
MMNMVLVFFVYGLTFFAMGLAIAMEVRHAGDPILKANFRYLAAYALLHSLVEWVDMARLLGQPIPAYVGAGLLVLSLLPLIQFGAQLLSVAEPGRAWLRWSPIGLLGLWVFGLAFVNVIVGVDRGLQAINAKVWARYVLYFPGCVLAALALLDQGRAFQIRNLPQIARDARLSAAAFALNGLFAGLVVPPAPYPPASLLNYTAFIGLVSIPPQVFRAVLASLVAFWVVRMLRVFEIERARELDEARQAVLEAAEQRSRGLAEEVARSEARYRCLFESARDAIFLHDLEGHFLEVNRAACDHLGYSREELLQMGVADIDTPEMAAQMPKKLAELLERGELLTESAHVRKDSTVVPVELSARLVEEGDQKLVLTFARDITERKQAEERLTVINELVRVISSGQTIEEVYGTFAREIGKLITFDRTSICVLNQKRNFYTVMAVSKNLEPLPGRGARLPVKGSVMEWLSAHPSPLVEGEIGTVQSFPTDHMLRKAGIKSRLIMPLVSKGEVIGCLNFGSHQPDAYSSADVEILAPLAEQMVIALEDARLHARVEQLAILEERDRIGREMHDGLGQVLSYLGVKTGTVREMLRSGETSQAETVLSELSQVVQEAYAEVREAILGLRATVAPGVGLAPALTEYLHRYQLEWGIAAELVVDERAATSFPSAVEIQLLRIIQEALTNVRKHSGARHAWVRFEADAEGMVIIVEDDGQGFDPARVAGDCFGLQTMRERAESVGGTLEVSSAPGAGTRVRVRLPHSALSKE